MSIDKATIDEISPELFLWELYDNSILAWIDNNSLAELAYGYCDAARLPVRPRSGLYALMLEYPDGERCWFHIDPKMKDLIEERRARMMRS